jgi:isoleucyl-tRNA synthetase
MSRFKATIRLPRTSLPMRPPPSLEAAHVERLTSALYRAQRAGGGALPPFHLLDGPPYANGSLHMGHFLNKVVKDVACRWKLLSGHAVRFEPGWDCHGLPIELKAVAEGATLSPLEVRARAGAFAGAAMAEQAADFRRWGVLADWELGARGARRNAYATMDAGYEGAQLRVFAALVRAGAVHRALRPVHWSPASRTALAEAELEYADAHASRAAFVAFPLGAAGGRGRAADGALGERLDALHAAAVRRGGGGGGGCSLPSGVHAVAWTTTPWTLPANVALAVHPEVEYGVFEAGEGGRAFFLVAVACEGELRRALTVRAGAGGGGGGGGAPPPLRGPLFTFPGAALLGAAFTLPFPRRFAVPVPPALALALPPCGDGRGAPAPARASVVIAGPHVRAAAGTGVVHTAPGHGLEDFAAVGAFNGYSAPPLPTLCAVDGAGRLMEGVCGPVLGGEAVLGDAASVAVAGALAEGGALLAAETVTHRVPYDWRTKTPVLTRATEQWFVDVGRFHDAAAAAVGGVRMTPPGSRARLLAALRGRAAWCISRQRVWGVPIPALFRSDTGAPVLTAEVADAGADLAAEAGSGAWWAPGDRVETALTPRALAAEAAAGGFSLTRGTDTLDVWFDSGTAWAAAGGDGRPADLVVEGSDQHRGWFQSSLLTAIAATGAAPFRAIATHGFVLDEAGRKMSKSLGNVVTPQQLLAAAAAAPPPQPAEKKKGAKAGGGGGNSGGGGGGGAPPAVSVDTLRFWVASSDFSRDVHVGPTILARTGEALRKVRNTLRFLVGATGGLDFAPGALFDARAPAAARGGAYWCAPPDALAAAWALPFPSHALLPERGAGGAWPLRALDAALLARAGAVEAGVRAAFEELAFERAVYLINGFAARDLSAAYCDAVKDRLYQEGARGGGSGSGALPPRLAAQAVLWECLRVLTRSIAPIAPFTAEEVYQASQEGVLRGGGGGGGGSTVFHTPWVPLPPALTAPGAAFSSGAPLAPLWGALLGLRSAVQGPLEAARAAGVLGSPAEAAVTLFVPPPTGGAGVALGGVLRALRAEPSPHTAHAASAPELEELLSVSWAAAVALPAGGEGPAAHDFPVALLPHAPPPQGAPQPPAAPASGGGSWWGWASAGGNGGEEGPAPAPAPAASEWVLVRVARAGGAAEKCARCWKFREEVPRSTHALCGRCEGVLAEAEKRTSPT